LGVSRKGPWTSSSSSTGACRSPACKTRRSPPPRAKNRPGHESLFLSPPFGFGGEAILLPSPLGGGGSAVTGRGLCQALPLTPSPEGRGEKLVPSPLRGEELHQENRYENPDLDTVVNRRRPSRRLAGIRPAKRGSQRRPRGGRQEVRRAARQRRVRQGRERL